MANVMARGTEEFMFRPGLPQRARYSAVIFLNQLQLSHRPEGKALAASLINVYFSMFKLLIKEGEKETAKAKEEQAASEGSGIQALQDVDARMLAALITGVRRAFPYVEQTAAANLVEKHTPHLFLLTHHSKSFPTAVQALSLLYQLLSAHQAISERFFRSLYAAALEAGSRDALDHLKDKAIKAASVLLSSKESESIAKIDMGDEEGGEEEEEEEEEEEADSDDNDKEEEETETEARQLSLEASAKEEEQTGEFRAQGAGGGYDMKKREPMFSGAETCCWWELNALASHSHPSVAAMAKTVLAGSNVLYSGDPMTTLNLSTFLDRFISRKPKAPKGGSETMQPKGARGIDGDKVEEEGSTGALHVSSQEFRDLAMEDVPAEDLFFHKYYANCKEPALRSKKADEDEDEDKGKEDGEDGEDEPKLSRKEKKKKEMQERKEKKKAKNKKTDEDDDLEIPEDWQAKVKRPLEDDDFGSETDEEEDAFLDKELQREVGQKVVDEEPGDYDYANLAAAMEGDDEDADIRLPRGTNDDEAGSSSDGEFEAAGKNAKKSKKLPEMI
eukprot:gene5290-6432_t